MVKNEIIEASVHNRVLSEICEALDISVSGYRAWTRGGRWIANG
jgi:hypothetical protein